MAAGETNEKSLMLHPDRAKRDEAMISSITSDFPGVADNLPDLSNIEHLPLIPINPLASLTSTVRDLTSTLDSTSTTRTSLLSTLESYTSTLHREVFLRSDRFGSSGGYSGGYSMSTLSANLAKAGGGGTSGRNRAQQGAEAGDGGLSGVGVKSEEWDAVRKEVRGIKGILLNRRNFASLGVNR